MSQKRQPKGITTGGQFAPDVHRESAVVLNDEPTERRGTVRKKDEASETCPGCGGANVRDLPVYDPTDHSNPFPGRSIRTCMDCGHQLAASGAAVSEADKQRYVDSIHTNLDDSGRYDPNDEGVKLIEESSIKITGELETHNGIAWTGELTIGDEVLHVSNNGDGGSNHYQIKDGGWRRIEELNDRVSEGFPGLAGTEALDDFCLVAEVVHADRLGDVR